MQCSINYIIESYATLFEMINDWAELYHYDACVHCIPLS